MSSLKGQPYKLLQEIAATQTIANVVVSDPLDYSIQWQFHLSGATIHYAYCINRSSERLKSIVNRYQPELLPQIPPEIEHEYEFIKHLWLKKYLTQSELTKILTNCTKEALIAVLAMGTAEISVNRLVTPLELPLIGLDLIKSANELRFIIYEWQQMRSYITSPWHQLELNDDYFDRFFSHWTTNPIPAVGENSLNIRKFLNLCKQHSSIYQSSYVFNLSPLEIQNWLLPLIKTDIVATKNFSQPSIKPKLKIACIDDSPSIQLQLRKILELGGYESIGIEDPRLAVTTLIKVIPNAIIMDLNMPQYSGHELLSLIKKERILQHIKVIMLTGRDLILDRLRARIGGADSYLTKPVDPQQLLKILHENTAPPK